MVLLAAGQPAEALDSMQQVIAQRPDELSPETNAENAQRWGGYYFHLAAAHEANGENAEAKKAMKMAEQLGFDEGNVFAPELDLYNKLKKLAK
jgi:hypothetical protein